MKTKKVERTIYELTDEDVGSYFLYMKREDAFPVVFKCIMHSNGNIELEDIYSARVPNNIEAFFFKKIKLIFNSMGQHSEDKK